MLFDLCVVSMYDVLVHSSYTIILQAVDRCICVIVIVIVQLSIYIYSAHTHNHNRYVTLRSGYDCSHCWFECKVFICVTAITHTMYEWNRLRVLVQRVLYDSHERFTSANVRQQPAPKKKYNIKPTANMKTNSYFISFRFVSIHGVRTAQLYVFISHTDANPVPQYWVECNTDSIRSISVQCASTTLLLLL